MPTEEEITKLRLDPQREKHQAQQRAQQYPEKTEEDTIRLNLSQERQAYELQLQAEQEEREPDPTKPTEKMGFFFFVAGLLLCVVGDLIDFFTGGTIGWLVGIFIDLILLAMFGMSRSGRGQIKKILIAVVGESIPVVDMLPLRTIFLCWSFIKSRSKIANVIDKGFNSRASGAGPVL